MSSATVTYTVRPGDTLASIAERYGVPGGWAALYRDNRQVLGANPNLVPPGTRLTVIATRRV